MNPWDMALAVLGLVLISAVTRSVFFLSDQPWTLPVWVERGLRYAPLAALAAVVWPEILTVQGHWPDTWKDARFVATPVAMAWAWWRRDMLTTILLGMAVLTLFRVGFGW